MAEGVQKDKLKEVEHAKASIRAKVEPPFHTQARLWICQGQIQRFGEKHQSNRDAVCARQSAQDKKEAAEVGRAAEQKKPRAVVRLKGI
jgi:hypothetical protein